MKRKKMFFLEFPCFLYDPMDVGNLISGSSAFSKPSLLKPGLQNFEHYFTSMWDECNCVVVWAFFGIDFLWDAVFPCGSDGKASACNAGDPGSIPGLGRSPGEGNGNLLQHSCVENPMDRGVWWAIWGANRHNWAIIFGFEFCVF